MEAVIKLARQVSDVGSVLSSALCNNSDCSITSRPVTQSESTSLPDSFPSMVIH